MKRRRTLLVFVSLCICISFANVFNVSAHDFSTRRIWHDIYYHSGMDKTVIRLNYNMDNVSDSVYSRKLNDAIWDWNWRDDGYVELNSVSSSDANSSGVMIYDTYPSNLNQSAFAITTSFYTSSNVTVYEYGVGWMGPPQHISCRRVNRAIIYANRARQSQLNFSEADIAKTWVHEIGHPMGFNETNDGTQSVMAQGQGSTLGWSEFWLPQDHDRQDVSQYHYLSWT